MHIQLLTWWKGRFVGRDAFGNRYFEEQASRLQRFFGVKPARHGVPKRWVLFKGMAEASKVDAQWHGWLHYKDTTPPMYSVHHTLQGHEGQMLAVHGDATKEDSQGNATTLHVLPSHIKPHQPNMTGTPYAYAPQGVSCAGVFRSYEVHEAWQPSNTSQADKCA